LLTGVADVARQAATAGPRFAPTCRLAMVNGAAGLVVMSRRGVAAVAGITVVDDKIVAIDLILDPDKLRNLVVQAG
jgi:RNA polymerase sigma-70 factor (ECF subfamily)